MEKPLRLYNSLVNNSVKVAQNFIQLNLFQLLSVASLFPGLEKLDISIEKYTPIPLNSNECLLCSGLVVV